PKEHSTAFGHRRDVVFIPARRDVPPSKSAVAVYGNVIGVVPDNGLHVGVDVADKAAVGGVRTRHVRTDTDNVTGRADVGAGVRAQGDVAVAAGEVNE